jgi:class 3 adenylate cyclase
VEALPSGTVTFLFTDVEGSTELLRRLGDGYAAVLSDQRRILRDTLGQSGAREIDTQGDAFFFSFTRARDAVAGAVEAQRALRGHTWPEDVVLKVRMGLHTGEPAVGDEGYVGLDVVRAARICSAGHGGQILLSETTKALLGGDLPDGVTLRDLGRQKLKDLEEEQVYELSLDEADRFPALKTEQPKPPSGAEILGEDFGQRIEDFVARSIEGSLPKGLPAPPARRKPSPPARPKPSLPLRFLVLAVLLGVAALVVLMIKLV